MADPVSRKRRGVFSQFHLVRRKRPAIKQTDYKKLPKARVLVLSPHPEEHIEKCFATIKGFLGNGSKVMVHVITPGGHGVELSNEQVSKLPQKARAQAIERLQAKIRLRKAIEADKLLGVKSKFHKFDFYSKGEVSKRDLQRMRDIISSERPAIVIMPSPLDLQPTHAVVYDLANRYLKRQARLSRKPIEVWAYDTPFHQLNLSELNQIVLYPDSVQLEKRRALQKHVSQQQRRRAEFTDQMAKAVRAMAAEEEAGGFGRHVDPKNVQHMEFFSKRVLKPYGPLVVSRMERK